MDPALVGRMGNDIGELGMVASASDPESAAGCGSSAVSSALNGFAESRVDALKRTKLGFSTTGTALVQTANDFSATDADIAATFQAMVP